MNYFDLTDDERQVWRGDTVSRAYKDTLRGVMADVGEEAFRLIERGEVSAAATASGKRAGLAMALDIMGRDR